MKLAGQLLRKDTGSGMSTGNFPSGLSTPTVSTTPKMLKEPIGLGMNSKKKLPGGMQTPEQQKELSDAFAAYDAKVRTFMDSRDLMKSKGANRGGLLQGQEFQGQERLREAQEQAFVCCGTIFCSGLPKPAIRRYGKCWPGWLHGMLHLSEQSPRLPLIPKPWTERWQGQTFCEGHLHGERLGRCWWTFFVSSMARPSMAIDEVLMNQISSPDLQGHAVLDTGHRDCDLPCSAGSNPPPKDRVVGALRSC